MVAGRSLPQALFMMMPGPWSKDPTLDENQRDFYRYAACLMTPWDGPAAMCFDGWPPGRCGAGSKRSAPRPLGADKGRTCLVLASESGVMDIAPSEVVRRGRLGPNQMLLLDTESGVLLEDQEIKDQYLERTLESNGCPSRWSIWKKLPYRSGAANASPACQKKSQRLFGWTYEDRMVTVLPIAQTGLDPVGSMGYDAPIAVLSERPQPLFHYFKQLFAQVTNPPIDAIQEECVTGMDVFLGSERRSNAG